MWFDPSARKAIPETERLLPATPATPATPKPEKPLRVAEVAEVARSNAANPKSNAPFGRSVGGRPLTETGGIVPGSQPAQSLADALAAPPAPVARTPEPIDLVWDAALDQAKTIQKTNPKGNDQ